MSKKHTTDARAAKVAGRYGLTLDDNAANQRANEPVAWRRVDSGNLARLASAMERVAGYMGRVTAAAERAERREERRELERPTNV